MTSSEREESHTEVKNFRHVLSLTSEVDRNPTKAVRLEQPFILYRTQSGDLVVLSDR